MKDNRIRYFESYDEDFFQSGEKYTLEKDYEYNQKGILKRAISSLTYGLALIFSNVYCRLFLHVRFVGEEKLRKERGAFFLYGNHTQPIGDVFNPALACFPKRIYTVVSPANLHLPVIGRLIRPLGGLPLPDTLSGMINFSNAIKGRFGEGHPIVIYPEAHLWDYYTGIRPFGSGAFEYATKLDSPVYCFTTTYQKRRFGKKPRITIYVDGPFLSSEAKRREKARELRDKVFLQMQERAKESNYEYIKYIQKSK